MTESAFARVARGLPVFQGGRPLHPREVAMLPANAIVYADEFGRHPIPAYSPPKPAPVAEPVLTAKDWLADLLALEPVLAATIHAKARVAGRSPKSIREACAALGIVPYQRSRVWWWKLPEPDDR